MAKIFSITTSAEKKHEIIIDDCCIVRDEEDTISFNIPRISWANHAQTCSDCKAFLESFGKETYNWILEVDDKFYLLSPLELGKREDYFSNLVSYENSKDYVGSRLRLMRKDADPLILEAVLIFRKDEEAYERCTELSNAIKYLKKQTL